MPQNLCSLEAEMAILSGILLGRWIEIDPGDFYRPAHRLIYAAAKDLLSNIYASTYACMTLSLLGKMDMLSDAQKKDWLHYFDRFQNPEDGLFYDPVIRNELFDQTDWWGARHLAVQVAQCYVILGGRPEHKIKCLEKYYNFSVFADYLNSLNIDDHNSDVDNHIMNLGVLLQYNRDVFEDKSAAEAVSFLQQWLRNKLNKNTGLLGRNTPQTPQEISRAIQFYYHLFVLFEYDNLNLPQIERVVDYALPWAPS